MRRLFCLYFMEHVLIIGKVWIEPKSSAAGSRTLQLIEQFQKQGWKVSLASAANASGYEMDVENLGIQTHFIEINSSSFDELLKKLQPTIVLFDRFTTEEQFGWRVAEHCPNALRILDTIDLHCLRLARHEALKQNREFTFDDLLSNTGKRELASIFRSDISLMISDYEMEILKNKFKVDNNLLHHTPFLFDAISKEEQEKLPHFEEREHFISIGNFLHEPNWDSILYMKQEIWQHIRKQLPKAELHIYGAYPTQKVFQLHNPKEGFLVKGRAEDAEEVMKRAKICLAPLRFGAGIKGKLSDAMRCGTPSVTTNIGAEAMHGNLPWNGAIENSPEKIAGAAVELYQNKMLWQQAQQNGFVIINQFFAKEKHAKKLMDKISFVQNNLQEHRNKNFIGAMLMHHSVASTKYMALWIEAKNKLR